MEGVSAGKARDPKRTARRQLGAHRERSDSSIHSLLGTFRSCCDDALARIITVSQLAILCKIQS